MFDGFPEQLPRLISVGRLDMASEGLLMLTNDGALARHMELPQTGWTRRYRVRVHGRVVDEELARLAEGVTVSGLHYGPIEAKLERQTGANAWLTVALREGKNRELRRVMEHLGYQVNRLIRTAYGPFQLGRLTPGEFEEVSARVGADQLPDFFAAAKTKSKSWAKPAQKKSGIRRAKKAVRRKKTSSGRADSRR